MKIKANNNTLIALVSTIFILVSILVLVLLTQDNTPKVQKTNQVNRQNCLSEDCLQIENLNYPAGELPQSVVDSLIEAINDEYKAYSTYNAVMKKFGNVRPFSMIIRAEEQHISSLKSIFDKYGLTVPENNFQIQSPSTLQLACSTGVTAEIANAKLYRDKLLPAVTSYSDITQVFQNLMNASEQKHLSAFQRCQ